MFNQKKKMMKTSKLTVNSLQKQGVLLAGGVTGATVQGGVAALGKKYAPDFVKPFVDPITIAGGVVIGAISKNDFVKAAGWGMALKPGLTVVTNQLRKVLPNSDENNALNTFISGTKGMGKPSRSGMGNPARIARQAIESRQRNDRFAQPASANSSSGLQLAL